MNNQEQFKRHIDLIWKIANLLRGPYRPPQYRKVMIPLTVLRRLDCVLENSKREVMDEYDKLKAVDKYDDETIETMIKLKYGVNLFNTSGFTFAKREEGYFGKLLDDADSLAANLNKFIAGFSSKARHILEKFKFEEEIEKLDEANRLFQIIKEFSNVDLHPAKVPNIAMGYIFEDLVRRFNEQANEEAGDHFTPREVIRLMVNLLYMEDDISTPGKVMTIYDPTCGTGGMLSISEEHILEHNPQAVIKLFGQEYNPESYAICGSDLLIKDEDVDNIVYGNTLGTGKSKEGFIDGDGHPDTKFHYMLANPPFGVEWKPEKDFVTREYNELGFTGRFGPGLPRINDGALLFLLHMISKRQSAPNGDGEGSRIAIVFNGSPLFTGDAGSGESNIRRWIIENDMLESVIGLPDQLFYNTSIFTYIWIVTNRKAAHRKGKVQLINATEFAWRMKKSLGNKRKEIGDGTENRPNHIAELTRIYGNYKHDERRTLKEIRTNIDPERNQEKEIIVNKIFKNHEFGYIKITVERPLRLNFIVNEERIKRFTMGNYYNSLITSKKRRDQDAMEKEIKTGKQAQKEILSVLETIKKQFANGEMTKDRKVFEKLLVNAYENAAISLDTRLKNELMSPGFLGEKDPTAEICRDSKGNPEPDPELRDTENVELPPEIKLPLPLGYETAKNKGKVDKIKLLSLVKNHCQTYLKKEVLPYRPDAWIDFDKTKIGYEIPFNRHFFQYEPPRELHKIEQDIKNLEAEILQMLKVVV